MSLSPRSTTKYQVFLSSTFKDLRVHRNKAVHGLLRTGHIPLAIENYPPATVTESELIQEAIRSCQFYLVILGHRYGSVPAGQRKGREKSYTELEYEWALKEKDLRILSFVLKDDIAEDLRGKLKRRIAEDQVELRHEEQYWRFRERLTKSRERKYYTPFATPEEIEIGVVRNRA